MRTFIKSSKLENVLYDIRGPVSDEAQRLQEEGFNVIKLNSGNPAPFGVEAPEEIIHDVIINIKDAEGYCDSKGLFSARKAVMQYCQLIGIEGVEIGDIYMGNGVSEIILISMQGLLDSGDEVLIPAPDYPLWTAAVNLSGGKAVHYLCDEESDWYPDLSDIKKKITSRTKGIVVINPNNPTGAVYPLEIVEKIVALAAEHQLIVFSDEIYDNILYNGAIAYHPAAVSRDVLFVTMNGLSKSHRVAGFRVGWMVISGNKSIAKDYIGGLNLLTSMRMCSNVPAQLAVQTALGGYQSLRDLIKPGGRLYEQMKCSYESLNSIPGLSCVRPDGALYVFPKMDFKKFNIMDDEKFALDFLLEKKVLITQGTGFNWPKPDHFRLVFLPRVDILTDVYEKLRDFLSVYCQ
ncbi:MAG: pyridoxal phosphate-dependent aminotransferase [Brevinematales bacterium]